MPVKKTKSIGNAVPLADIPSTPAPADLCHDVLNSIEQGVLVWDADSKCQIFNQRIFAILEIGEEELYCGAELNDFLYRAVQRKEVTSKQIDETLARHALGAPHSHSLRLKSGRQVMASVRPRSGGGGIMIFSDLSGLLTQEMALQSDLDRAETAEAELDQRLAEVKREKQQVEERQSELQRMSLVATHTTDMIIIADATGKVEWVNGACTALFGGAEDRLVGRNIVDVITGDWADQATYAACRNAVVQRGRTNQLLQIGHGNAEEIWLDVTVSPVFSSDGVHTHVIAVGRDVTASRQAHNKELAALAFEQRKVEESKLLSDFNEWLHSSDSLDELFAVVSGFLGRLLPRSKGTIFIYSNSRDVLAAACSWNNAEALPHFQAGECWALRRGRSYLYSGDSLSFPCQHVQTQHGDATPEHYVCLPIIAHGDTVGLMYMEMEEGAEFEDMEKLAGFCAEQISLAIANVRLRVQLRDQSTRDPLTALYNRRHFLDAARREIGRVRNDGGVVSIISLDVDHFKTFNDTYGHDAGDMVLRALSEKLLLMFRTHDVPCRYGGEEFVILMPGATNEVAIARANELRQKIESYALRYGSEALKITISAGVASFPAHGDNVQAVMKSADEALYQAKAAGRNRVSAARPIHGDEMSESAEDEPDDVGLTRTALETRQKRQYVCPAGTPDACPKAGALDGQPNEICSTDPGGDCQGCVADTP